MKRKSERVTGAGSYKNVWLRMMGKKYEALFMILAQWD